jgi:hypothetical protein
MLCSRRCPQHVLYSTVIWFLKKHFSLLFIHVKFILLKVVRWRFCLHTSRENIMSYWLAREMGNSSEKTSYLCEGKKESRGVKRRA